VGKKKPARYKLKKMEFCLLKKRTNVIEQRNTKKSRLKGAGRDSL